MIRSWLIEAAVWCAGFAGAAAMIVLGEGSWVRVLGCVLLVPIGLRAAVRTIRLFMSKLLRDVTVVLNVPEPSIGGPFASAMLASTARLVVERKGSSVYFIAYDASGGASHLVEVEPEHESDYRALAAWIGNRVGRHFG